MTTLEKVGEIVIKFKKGKVTADKIKPTASLAADLGLDSLDLSELLVLAEDAFKLQIPPEDLNKVKTLGEVAQYIDKRLKA